MTSPAIDTLERTDTRHRINPTAHWWHAVCQGKEPGPKVCYCGAKINAGSTVTAWTGNIITEDCIVCIDLISKSNNCPLCGKDIRT